MESLLLLLSKARIICIALSTRLDEWTKGYNTQSCESLWCTPILVKDYCAAKIPTVLSCILGYLSLLHWPHWFLACGSISLITTQVTACDRTSWIEVIDNRTQLAKESHTLIDIITDFVSEFFISRKFLNLLSMKIQFHYNILTYQATPAVGKQPLAVNHHL